MSLERTNQEIVARFWDAFSRNDHEDALALLDDREFTWWILGSPQKFCLAGARDKAAFRELLSGVSSNTRDGIRMNPSGWTTQGERVAMEAESHAQMSNGKAYNNLYHFLHIVRDGKIRMVKEYLDTQHATEILCG
jgi:ketosteroid isomerase-like protein